MSDKPNGSKKAGTSKAGANSNAKSNIKSQQTKKLSRKEQQQAEKEAQEAQAARDRRTQTIIGVVVVSIIAIIGLTITGFVLWNNYKQSHATELAVKDNKPSNATDTGGFILSKNGVNNPVSDAPTLEEYMDFLCPGCGQINRSIDEDLKKMVEAGQINVEIHPNAFLDRLSKGDQYSSRTAAAVVYVAQNDPDHVLDFISSLFDADFQPDETNYSPVTDAQIKDRAVKAGVNRDVADKCTDGTYAEWIEALRVYTPTRPELQHTTGSSKGSMTTPTLLINGNYWIDDLDASGLQNEEALLKALGIEKNQIGDPSVKPSIGAKGKPNPLT